MGFIFGGGNPFGTGDYQVAQGLPGYTPGSTLGGVQGAQAGSQNSIAQQQAFLNALNMQGGLSGTQSGIMGQQQGLANQFGQIAAGQGPNPAQAQLAQNTGQNIQQQAALMGSARGAQTNPGLVARQASQVGGNMQQQAVGQAATLSAQQQIAAMQNQAAQQGQMASLATAGVGQQQTALSQLGQQNLGYQQQLQGALTSQNEQQVQAQEAQSKLAGIGMQQSGSLIGGALGGLGSLLGGAAKSIGFDTGGQVPPVQSMDVGGYAGASLMSPVQISQGLGNPMQIQQQTAQNLPHPMVQHAQEQKGTSKSPDSPSGALYQGGKDLASGIGDMGKALAKAAFASDGGAVGGQAQVKGDSVKNDNVPAMLSPGEVVIPRSHIDDPHKTAQFLNSLMGWNLRAS